MVEVVDWYAVLLGVPVSGVTERQPAMMTMNAMVNAARNLLIMNQLGVRDYKTVPRRESIGIVSIERFKNALLKV